MDKIRYLKILGESNLQEANKNILVEGLTKIDKQVAESIGEAGFDGLYEAYNEVSRSAPSGTDMDAVWVHAMTYLKKKLNTQIKIVKK